ncbi:hypothetical protein BaRGS_00009368 [Batillaria attramentaria]|uniref:Uncharacterized protein n=1 Tax=Batillaria attramentaria TaxID=370345 RepID=A0ABD0LJP6_9CAEN
MTFADIELERKRKNHHTNVVDNNQTNLFLFFPYAADVPLNRNAASLEKRIYFCRDIQSARRDNQHQSPRLSHNTRHDALCTLSLVAKRGTLSSFHIVGPLRRFSQTSESLGWIETGIQDGSLYFSFPQRHVVNGKSCGYTRLVSRIQYHPSMI